MRNRDFTKIFLDNIKAGDKVLDLGAGSGEFSRMFADRGARTTAVDINVPESSVESIDSKRMKVEDFVTRSSNDQYDLVFMRNILQFLDKQWVFEVLLTWLIEHVSEGGVIAIETFYQEPNPPFAHPMRSLYSARELLEHFLPWQELCVEQYDHRGLDLIGETRHFFVTDLIVKKA